MTCEPPRRPPRPLVHKDTNNVKNRYMRGEEGFAKSRNPNQRLKPFVTNSIWLGKMNEIRKRVQPRTDEEVRACDRIEQQQSDDRVKEIFGQLKDEPLVRWKDSIKKVMGLKMAAEAGMDQ